jgi:hypothetical protein
LADLLGKSGLRPTSWRSSYLVPHKIPIPFGRRRQFLRLGLLTGLDRLLGWVSPFDRLGWCLMVRAER